jgi:hypothetical protein
MSIGFTVPVVMLCQGPLSDARSIVMFIVGFCKRTLDMLAAEEPD